MNTLFKSYPLDGRDTSVSVVYAADIKFNRCGQLDSPRTLNLGRADNNGLSGESFSISMWLKRGSAETALGCLGTKGWQVDSQGRLHLTGDSHKVALSHKTWQHVCLVQDASLKRRALYLDGVLVRSLESNQEDSIEVLSADDEVILSVVSGSANIAHLHCYQHGVNQTEILVDLDLVQQGSKSSFTQQYPLDINIVNDPEGEWSGYPDNKLLILDAAGTDLSRQLICVSNISEHDIKLSPQTALPNADHYHFKLSLRHGTFVQSELYPKFEAVDTWRISSALIQNSEAEGDGSWSLYFAVSEALTLKAGENLYFAFEYVSADGGLGARGSQLAFSYQQMGFDEQSPVQGQRFKQIDILNLSSNNTYITKMNEGITKADARVNSIEDDITAKLSELKDGKQEGYQPLTQSFDDNTNQAPKVKEVLALLAQHGMALDDEVDLRALVTDKRLETLEALYPLEVSYDAPSGLVCNNEKAKTSSLSIYLHNRSNEDLRFTDNGKVKLIVPIDGKKGQSMDTLLSNEHLGLLSSSDKRGIDGALAALKIQQLDYKNKVNAKIKEVAVALDESIKQQFELELDAFTGKLNLIEEAIHSLQRAKQESEKERSHLSLAKCDDDAGKEVELSTNAQGWSKLNQSPSSSIFQWTPEAGFSLAAGESFTLSIENIQPNSVTGRCFIKVEVYGLKNQQNNVLSLPITKTNRDLAELAGNGNVGIGTESPNDRLDVAGNIHASGTVKAYNLYLENSCADITWQKGENLQFGTVSNSNGKVTKSSGFSEKMRITGSGNVGIGTTSPNEKLEVAGSIKADKFIDRNNSAYYLDPASTSILNSVRAEIYYDKDDTRYYVNPASSSNLKNTLTADNLTARNDLQGNGRFIHDLNADKIRYGTISKNRLPSIKLEWGSVKTTGYINNWDKAMDKALDKGYVVVGLKSVHNNGKEDRRWKLKYRSLKIKIG